jgi:AraC-like DNA-binding protein
VTILAAAGHGAAGALFLLIAALLWRDRRTTPAGRLAAALTLGAAAAAADSAPGFDAAGPLWRMPIAALAAGAAVVFWLWARAAFDDEFAPRRWHVAPWAILAIGGVVADVAPLGRVPAHLAAQAVAVASLGFAVAAAVQTVATWHTDLVARRRRLRVIVLVGTVSYIVANSSSQLARPMALGMAGWAGAPDAIGLCTLAALAAWSLLRVTGYDSAAGLVPPTRPARGAATIASPPDAEPKLPPADAALLRRLEQAMTQERIYRQDGLTISALAAKLRVPEHRLRQTINGGLGHANFNVFVNHWRIAEAKTALADPAQAEVPVLTIAMDAGFRSIGPFNRAFKAHTGMTPTEYRLASRGKVVSALMSRGNLEISKPD